MLCDICFSSTILAPVERRPCVCAVTSAWCVFAFFHQTVIHLKLHKFSSTVFVVVLANKSFPVSVADSNSHLCVPTQEFFFFKL